MLLVTIFQLHNRRGRVLKMTTERDHFLQLTYEHMSSESEDEEGKVRKTPGWCSDSKLYPEFIFSESDRDTRLFLSSMTGFTSLKLRLDNRLQDNAKGQGRFRAAEVKHTVIADIPPHLAPPSGPSSRSYEKTHHHLLQLYLMNWMVSLPGNLELHSGKMQ